MPTDEWSRIIDINVTGMFQCSRAAARSMKPRDEGAIVNIASVDALSSSAEGMVHSTTSKHAIAGFTKSWAMELPPPSVRVNAVCPGAAMTEGTIEFTRTGTLKGIDV
jgi:3-oxoacyl-[acyl-carrier protein] reductase